MAGLKDFRSQHPEYNDMPDKELADSLHAKFYSDIPKNQFDKKMGVSQDTNWGRMGATTVGGVLGGIAAAPAAGLASIPTMGVGGVATEMIGVGLGAGLGGQTYDFFEEMLRDKKSDKDSPPQRKTFPEAAGTAVTDVVENALLVPAGRAIGEVASRAAPYVMPYVRPIIDAIPGVKTKAERLADALIKKATFAGEETSYAAEQQGKTALATATEAQRRAAVAKLMSEAAEREKAAAAAAAQRRAIPAPQKLEMPPDVAPLPPTRIGQVREAKAEIGKPVQIATSNEERNIIAQRAKNDTFLRQSRNAIVAENEAKGAKITATPSYQAIVKRAEPIANWERSGARKPDSSIAKTYKEFLSKISPVTVELKTAKDVAIATKNGFKVRNEGDKFYRDVDPTFENIDEARRFLGDVFSGKKASEGYGALKEKEQKELYRLLKNVEEEYVGAAQPRLQKNWREATAKLQQFKEGVGPKIIEAEPEKVAEILFKGKGAGSFDEAVAAAGNERIPRKALSDQLATDLADKDYKGAVAIYNSKYKQVLQNPKLSETKQRVEKHLRDLNDSEIQGRKAQSFVAEENVKAKTQYQTLNKQETQRVQEAKERATQAGQKAQQQGGIAREADIAAKRSEGEVTRSSVRERIHTNKVTDILGAAQKDPAAGADKAIQYLKKLADGGQISTDDYRIALKEYNQIDFKKPAEARQRVKKILGYGANVGLPLAGVGGAGYYLGTRYQDTGNR
jgi:hypothetical protein